MAILKKELTALKKDFKVLEKKMEKLLKTAGPAGQTKRATKAKVAVKAKPAPKAVAKKTGVKKVAAKKTGAGKKAAQATATDQILKIIKQAKKGVDVSTLKKKTGFDDKKVRNIVFRAAKEGRIKKSGRGVYVGA